MLAFISPESIHKLGLQAARAQSHTAGKILARYLSCHWQPGGAGEMMSIINKRVIVICETVDGV